MTSVEYFFNEAFTISANADLFAENVTPVDDTNYDYIFTFNGDLNDFFSVRTYQQNDQDINEVNITLTLNDTFFNEAATAYNDTVASSTSGCLTTGFETSTDFSTRVLEVLAMKIFGHGKARAAISNDTDIVATLQTDIMNHIQNVLDTHKHDIYNEYVQTDNPAINDNDVTAAVEFNFTGDILSFPAFITGTLVDESNLSADLRNGPSVGGNVLQDANYNVPILIRIGSV